MLTSEEIAKAEAESLAIQQATDDLTAREVADEAAIEEARAQNRY